MTTLVELTVQEIEDYINGLDLAAGSEAYRTMATMLLLSPEKFRRTVSALKQGLIGLSDIKVLPAVNDLLVEQLINGRLGDSDLAALAYKYRTEWVPAAVDLVALRTRAVASATSFMASKFFDYGTYVLRPQYDLVGADETKFRNYTEAYSGYIRAASGAVAKKAIQDFVDLHVIFKATNPGLVQVNDDDNPIYQIVTGLQTSAVFLEQPSNRNATQFSQSALFSWIIRGSFEFVSYGTFQAFLTEAYDAMALEYGGDPSTSGVPGAIEMYNTYPVVPVDDENFEREFAYAWLARVHLPRAYGSAVAANTAILDNEADIGRVLSYLRGARIAIRRFRAALTSDPRPADRSGQPTGLLLALTSAPALDPPIERLTNLFYRDPATGNEAPGSPIGLLLAITHV